MATRWLDRALFIGLVTAAYAGVAALVVLLFGGAAPDWLLPTAVVLACLTPRAAPSLAASPRRSAARALVAVLLFTVGGAVTYGALATESRHWDGAVAWDAKANRLAASPTLEQPYFRDRHVYSHSRDYPLLQPVTVALLDRAVGVGRILFPCALLTACAAIGLALQRWSRDELVPLLAVAASAVTPNFVNPTSGTFDSGYSDGALALVGMTLIWFAPFLPSPIDDLDHHIRSPLPLLLDHGVGAAWLLTRVGSLPSRERLEPLAEAQA